MGHYRSEMGYEARDKEELSIKEKKIQKRTAKIQKMIDEKGIARVLAEAEISINDLYWPGIL